MSNHDAPLAFYIFSSDRKRIKRLTSSLGFGGGCVNDVVVHLATAHMPFGGFGASGMGAYHGSYLLFYLGDKPIVHALRAKHVIGRDARLSEIEELAPYYALGGNESVELSVPARCRSAHRFGSGGQYRGTQGERERARKFTICSGVTVSFFSPVILRYIRASLFLSQSAGTG